MTHRAAQVAALDADKSKVIAHYAEQERQAAADAQQAKDAEFWRRFVAQCPTISGHLISKWALEDEQ